MPSDIGDLRDVVDAINKLCDTMKTSSYESVEDCSQTVEPLVIEEISAEEAVIAEVEGAEWYVASQVEAADEVIFKKVEHYNTETWRQSVSRLEAVDDVAREAERWSDPSELLVGQELAQALGESHSRHEAVEDDAQTTERWSDSSVSLLGQETSELAQARLVAVEDQMEPTERWSDTSVFLPEQELSDHTPARLEAVENAQRAETTERWSDFSISLPGQEAEHAQAAGEGSEAYYTASSEVSLLSEPEEGERGERREEGERGEVVAGHVAAMRERFESMTRANTPCPDARDVTTSPDHL